MKKLLFVFLFIGLNVFANPMPFQCPPGSYRYQVNYFSPPQCLPFGQAPGMGSSFCVHCQAEMQNHMNFNWGHGQSFYWPMMAWQTQPQMPWWAMQGNMYYPNMHFPGAWQGQGMNHQQYPGSGPVMMGKPNIYIDTKEEVNFDITFSNPNQEFIATAPYLDDSNSWKVKAKKDYFFVDGVAYGYLFYDARASLEDFQFEQGVCSTRDSILEIMQQDLIALEHSQRSLEDFSKYWKIKMPNYPYYCLYPQYNNQMQKAAPLKVSLEADFSRVLYILIPLKSLALKNKEIYPPLPQKDFTPSRPSPMDAKIKLKEWGVAFLINSVIKH
jgi:hypothetical protein